MSIEYIPFEKTGKFSKLILDYCQEKDSVNEFVDNFSTLENVEKKMKQINFPKAKRELLVKRLLDQYSKGLISDNVLINKLLKDNTFTVTTGHQLCLFGGPQYFVSKIVSTIKLSLELKKKNPENNFIPVFWLASEDHDFDEINTVKLFGKELKADLYKTGPVGRLDASIFSRQISELKEIVGDSENAKELIQLFSNAYQKGNTLAQATRIWVHALFSEYNLVIVDGDDIELKDSFSSLMKSELLQRKSIEYIEKTSANLLAQGYNKQVTPREINLFYVEDGLRERIVYEKAQYKVLNTNYTFSESEIVDLLERHPERFSPNAIFRPLYQESILPNLAYIGGPGELAYWFQLKSNFTRLNVSFPILILRDSFVTVSIKQANQFQQLGFSLSDVFRSNDELNSIYLKSISEGVLHFETEEALLNELKNQLLEKVKGVDSSLIGMVEAEMKGIGNLFSKLEKKLLKAQKNREEVNINQIRKFRNTILPNDRLVERAESFIPNYLSLGKGYVELLVGESDVFRNDIKVILK